ncbi:cytochrome C class I [Sphingomonas spermidinifaciens]|uniref:Cytochrome C class I n=1 Tax=Sphingomonas spermidinifaciens TaxID=1141889 RepID=A0A2A4B3Z7_9SPHN|nr:c-type cytochrome [Sphingomonas spermidinifaciens]PCD02675.1 cytochrome C class I [Sphingomonas spermidinifaciens]
MRGWTMVMLGLGVSAASPALAGQAAPDPGKQAFAPCSACHAVTPNTKRMGPSLHGVVGRKVAGAPGFAYSPALKAKGGAWTPAALDAFLADPRGWAPGNRMSYPGVKDPAKRAAIIAYLKTLK